MKKLNNTNETLETKFTCEFCKAKFSKDSTLIRHLCEKKKRWIEKDLQTNRLGYQTFVQFYNKHLERHAARKTKTYEEFIYSPYYKLFIKFSTYCLQINCLNVSKYVEWLLHNGIKHDSWNSDSVYTKFLISYLKTEDPYDAVKRSIKFCMDLAEENNIQSNDSLRYVSTNKLCHHITNGRISPWVLYCSESGVKFLDKLDITQKKMIMDYIDPDYWALKLKREMAEVSTIAGILKEAKW
jgi:hypothetical protein